MAATYVMLRNQYDLESSFNNRYEAYVRADELRQSSDDLTRMARTYAVTGDDRYEKMYRDILDIRNGKKPRPERYESIYWDLVLNYGDKPRPDGETKSLESAGNMAKEDLSAEVGQHSHDEIGVLSRAMGEVTHRIRDVVTNISNNSEKMNTLSDELVSVSETLSGSAQSLPRLADKKP